jgi:hypothetical protein
MIPRAIQLFLILLLLILSGTIKLLQKLDLLIITQEQQTVERLKL